ncbi:MAG TPA: helix-turn-helix domain-containing protein [Pyrinomonadaceae bacterium]
MKDEAHKDGETRTEFLTARQLGAVLQVSESTVRRLAHSGRIPSIRITPHIIRFRLAAVVEALDGARRSRRSTRAEDNGADDSQLSFFE